MQRNYYQDLQISRDATESDIANAYRKLSLKYHPKLNVDNPYSSYKNFCMVSEAYQVLSDPVKRTFYDKYGEFKLKEGFFSQQNLKVNQFNNLSFIGIKNKGGYAFEGCPEEIFEKFFGTNNPFKQIYDSTNREDIGEFFRYPFANLNKNLLPPKDLNVEVECTLYELYNGCTKEVKYQRNIINKDGRTIKEITEVKKIEIKPGYYNGQRIVYDGLGHQEPGVNNSNLTITIKELPHKTIKRLENDLIYLHKISLVDAFAAKSIEFVTFDKRKLLIPMDQVINPQTVKLVQGEGMPIYNPEEFKVENFNQPLLRGDLYIKFEIQIPKKINDEKVGQLEQLLEQMQQC